LFFTLRHVCDEEKRYKELAALLAQRLLGERANLFEYYTVHLGLLENALESDTNLELM
jgi:hypothetical protein